MPEVAERTAPARPRKKQSRPATIVLLAASLAAMAGPAVITYCNAAGPERWALAALNLYTPQVIWAIPPLVVLPLCLLFARRIAWLPVLALIWAVGPVMGLCIPLGRPHAGPGSVRLRVMTYNVKAVRERRAAIREAIESARPDLMILQEAGQLAGDPCLSGYYVSGWDQYLVASRWPITAARGRRRVVSGLHFNYATYTVDINGREVAVYDVHLISPRWGLAAVRHLHRAGIGAVEGTSDGRVNEANAIAADVREERGPTIVAGDLNAPLPSLSCRAFTDLGLADAFAAAGFGYGFTYGHNTKIGRSFLRIDHVLASSHFEAVQCFVGSGAGSDHRPVIADLILSPTGP